MFPDHNLMQVVGASFFQPVNQHLQLEKDKSGEDKLLLKSVHSDGSQCTDDEDILYTTTKPTVIEIVKPKTLASRLSDAMDLKLLKDLIFINIIVGISLTYTATVNFSMIFPYFLQVEHSLFGTLMNIELMKSLPGDSRSVEQRCSVMYVSFGRNRSGI